MGNIKEDSSNIQKINSITNAMLQQFESKRNDNEIKRLQEKEESENRQKEHELEIEKAKIEFTEMGVVRLFTEIIDSRVLSSLWDKPEEATYNLFGRKNIITPAYFGSKEVIVFSDDRVSLDLERRTYEKYFEEPFCPFNDGPNFNPLSRISVIKIDNEEYKVGFNKDGHFKDRFICDYIKENVVEKDKVVDTIINIVATYITLKKQSDYK